MRVDRLVAGVALFAGVTGLNVLNAAAADLPMKSAPAGALLTTTDWSGFYLGGHVGWGKALSRGTFDDSIDSDGIDFRSTGAIYGIQGGYNWQAGRLVYGVELNGTWGNLDSSRIDTAGDEQRIKTDMLASALFRSGAAIDNVWIFGTIGVGYAKSEFTATGSAPSPASQDLNGWGWVSGVGAEYALNPNWSLRGEYLYYAITERKGIPDLTTASDATDFAKIDGIHVVRLAANYRFNGTPGTVRHASPAMNWSGLYIGAHGGYGRSHMPGTYDEAGDNGAFDIDPIGAVGGLQIGYNMQSGAWVYGLEVDGSWSGMKDDRIDGEGDTQELKTRSLASVRGRVGISADNRLYYLTAGWGWVNSRLNVNESGDPFDTTIRSSGLVLGGGVDWALNSNWSVRMEGLTYFTDKHRSLDALTPDSEPNDFVRQDMVSVVRVGVNYRFGGAN